MENAGPEERRKGYVLMRAILDYGMGVMIMAVGVFLLIAPKLGFVFNGGDFFRYGFAVMCFIYGGWRAYRGYKKNYFR